MMNQAPAPAQGGGEQNPKAEIQAKLISLLEQASKIAADNGIDFQSILMQFMQGKAGPPMPPMGMQ